MAKIPCTCGQKNCRNSVEVEQLEDGRIQILVSAKADVSMRIDNVQDLDDLINALQSRRELLKQIESEAQSYLTKLNPWELRELGMENVRRRRRRQK